MFQLSDAVSVIPGIGDARIAQLDRLDIRTLEDLIYHVPFRYDDRSDQTAIAQVPVGETISLVGEVLSVVSQRTRSGMTIQKGLFTDGTDTLAVVWFNQPFLSRVFAKDHHVILTGKVKQQGGTLTLQSPTYELVQPSLDANSEALFPVYSLTQGLSNKWMRAKIRYALKATHIPDWMPEKIKATYALLPLADALQSLHDPQSSRELALGKERLAFDELFLLQLRAQRYKSLWQEKSNSHMISMDEQLYEHYRASLPFDLTSAQVRVISEILADMAADIPMNRLLQGDVGSGKTAVAAAALLASSSAGLASVVMAPTEILADQHARTLRSLLEPLGVHVSVQTRNAWDDMEPTSVIVGTHAVLHRELPADIGLVIIDEQHRFGVSQRAQLLDARTTPNVLSMTATPIPRTIALSLYADLDMSVIDEMPVGRAPVTTWALPEGKRANSYAWIRAQVRQHQARVFVVCPFIDTSETPAFASVAAAVPMYEYLRSDVFPDLSVGMVHGKMSSQDKDAAIAAFADGTYDILVATPVIEVGIDIPEATVMVIESADRFGLAALHQLRGRVGRGGGESYCMLYSSSGKPSSRLKHLERVHSGLKLAELDMEQRGAGELYGTKQSGYINLKIASLTDALMIEKTYQAASTLLDEDPTLSSWPTLARLFESLLAKTLADN